jgi:enediyne biosynthesis protein E4
LFRNLGKGRFEEITDRAGRAFSTEDVGRGAAFGDLDNDGDTDIVVANDNGPVRVLVNNIGSRAGWIGLRLVTGAAEGPALRRRDALGARIGIAGENGVTRWRRARADGSYASANDPRVLVGLGAAAAHSVNVRVVWPSGRIEEWSAVPTNRYSTLSEGTGISQN